MLEAATAALSAGTQQLMPPQQGAAKLLHLGTWEKLDLMKANVGAGSDVFNQTRKYVMVLLFPNNAAFILISVSGENDYHDLSSESWMPIPDRSLQLHII